MEKNKKTDLFRFVTTRSPEVISKARIDLGFIYHPDEANSFFLADLIGITDIPAGRIILAGKAVSYVTNNTPHDIKNLDTVFWDFSDWLVKNKGNLTRTLVDAKIVALPSSAKILEIWDDMLFDVLLKNNPNVRETCLQLIIAINFAQKYTSYTNLGETDIDVLAKEAKDLNRLAEGKVVLHQSFTKEKDTSYTPSPYSHLSSYRRHEALHNARISSVCASRLKGVKEELRILDKTYEKDYSTAHDSALGTYQGQVKQAVNSFLAANPDVVSSSKINVEKTLKTINVSKSSSKEILEKFTRPEINLEEIIPSDLIESFDFTYKKPLEKQYAETKLSKLAFGYVKSNLLESEPIGIAVKKLDKEIYNCEKLAHAVFKKKPKEFLVNGIPVKVNGLGLRDYSISFKEVVSEVDGSISHSVYFSLETGYDNAFIRTGSYTLKIGTDVYTTTDFKLLSNVSESIFGELYADGSITTIPEHAILEFEATIELNNGQTYTINADGLTSNSNISGSAVPNKSNISNPVIHYGVNTIGVADYRKVEQELCCYVPGEVAHIENIMAREYMEKSTRSVTRTEFSMSSETERETEKSLDTSATSRNEMSSEVAEVINEDSSKNFGVSAGVSGEVNKVTISANGSADFSSGKSASDSNSTARTYAEDLTRRALERITQKVSSKRSSKLMKEFEEKNSHGFDNRAGDKHVTGVYRWIDKIYKNRIVNYGKRLIYEFMIPEPARWYKEAIIIKAEETVPLPLSTSDNSDEVLLRPEHPSTFGIVNANEISRTNYSGTAAEYGIETEAPPERFANVSISFSEAIGTGDKEQAFHYDTLRIGEDYECTWIKGQIDCSYHSTSQEYGFIKCHVAGYPFGTGFGDGESWSRRININTSVNDVEGVLPISVSCFKTTGYAGSVVANCELKQSVFEKWQQAVYKELMDAYTAQLEAYKRAEKLAKEEEERERMLREQAKAEAPKDTKMVTNSKFNSLRVKTELKRLCIEMLTKPFGITLGKDFYQNGKHDIPQIKLGSALDNYGSHVKFFEQAFDWDILAQKFYPYYWADRSDWKSLFQTQDGLNYSFQAFLQSGMGRVIVPVREGFEDAVTYFMETGEIWNGSGIVIDTNDKLYLSIVDETTNVEGVVEGQEWETIVPTSLRILQGKSVFLDEEGLPCCTTDGASTLLPDTNVLNATPPEV